MPYIPAAADWTPDPLNADCPSRIVIDLIADKWAILVIAAIAGGAERNGQLLRRVGGISQKALTRSLRDLEAGGLVDRFDRNEIPPRVDYRLTDLGISLLPLIRQLCDWAIEHRNEITRIRPADRRRTTIG